MTPDSIGKRIEERHAALRSLRDPWLTLWQEIARYMMPRRLPGLNGTVSSPGTGNDALLFDTTAVRANMTLANGQLAWMSPLEASWFAFDPAPQVRDDAARQWLAKATEIARDELAVSNFYTAVHEFYLDRGAFGTGCLYLEPGRRTTINAQAWPVGTFVIDEDENGVVDTVIREFQLTARQALQKFGPDKVSANVKKKAGEAKSAHDKIRFLHAIYPRADAERDASKLDGPNMPIASVYLECDGCHVCQVGGYEEMPVMVSRYLEWGSGLGSLYGWSPAFSALPEARQVNFLQKMGDALAEKAAFPPILAPEDLEGEIDANANGVTYFSRELAQSGAMPKEWQTAGRYDILLDRVKHRQEAIEHAFHVELFQMFARINKQMTAREVAERAQEKLIQFSPTFSRLTSELFNPMLERVIGILARAGKLPGTMPAGIARTPYRIQYSSRIALALRALPTLGYQRSLERLSMIGQIAPDTLDNFNFDEAERATAIADGVPADFLRSAEEVEKMRAARAQAAAQQQQQQAALAGAQALKDIGSVKPGSPVEELIKAQVPAAA